VRWHRRSALVLLAGSIVLLGPGTGHRRPAAAATSHDENRTFVAVLPQIGTVYVRYDCMHGRRFSMGIRIPRVTATTEVRFRAGSFARDADVQPGAPTRWFRYTSRRVERLAAAVGEEDGTVVGSVRVVAYSRNRLGACDDGYDPPRATIQTYPRRFPPPGLSLRKLIG
jgi:hypothetical protein